VGTGVGAAVGAGVGVGAAVPLVPQAASSTSALRANASNRHLAIEYSSGG
jgi:hypothetical protein